MYVWVFTQENRFCLITTNISPRKKITVASFFRIIFKRHFFLQKIYFRIRLTEKSSHRFLAIFSVLIIL